MKNQNTNSDANIYDGMSIFATILKCIDIFAITLKKRIFQSNFLNEFKLDWALVEYNGVHLDLVEHVLKDSW